LEGVCGFLIKMHCSNEKFWFVLGASSTKLNKGINPIAFPKPLVFFFYPIQPRNIILVSYVGCGSKQLNRVFKIHKMVRSYFEYPRATRNVHREDVIHPFRHVFCIWVRTTESVNNFLKGEGNHYLGNPDLLLRFISNWFRNHFLAIFMSNEFLPFSSKRYDSWLFFNNCC
jgi:hypothetical protein